MEAQAPAKQVNWILIGVVVVLVVLLALVFSWYRAQRKIVALTELNQAQTQRLDDFSALGSDIRDFNRKYGAKYGRIQNLTNIDSINSDLQMLQAKNPNPPSDVDSLLSDFRETAEKISYLSDKIDQIERDLGSPAVVKGGDTQYKIAMNYLTSEAGLPKDEAAKILKRTALIYDLAPGNYVYNLYYNGIFLTTVTQGTAKISPLLQQQSAHRATQSRIQALQDQLDSLMAKTGVQPTPTESQPTH